MISTPIPSRGIGLALLALAGPSVLVAGCGGDGKTASVARLSPRTTVAGALTTTASAAPAARPGVQRLIAYSACMRRNGVPDFPDPNSKGNLVLTPSDHINPTSPQFEQARNACKKLSPQGGAGAGMTPAQHAQALAALTHYVACMRGHAIPMADPFSGPNGGVGIALPRSVNPSSELYRQADAACKHFLPNGG